MSSTKDQFIYIMVGKKTFDRIITSLLISTTCLVSSCQIRHYWGYDVSNTSLTGTYVFNQIDSNNEIVESDTLVLEENGMYHFHTYLKYHDMSNMDVFPTTGVWKTIGNAVFLNSIVPCENDSCFIEAISNDNEDEDLVVVEVIQLSTGMPLTDYTVLSIHDGQYDSIAITDKSGKVAFNSNHTSEIDISDPNGLQVISHPRRGFIYRVYYRDCYLRIHKNQELIIKKDTLLLRKRGVVGYSKLGMKRYKTFEYPFVKVDEATTKEAPCTTP